MGYFKRNSGEDIRYVSRIIPVPHPRIDVYGPTIMCGLLQVSPNIDAIPGEVAARERRTLEEMTQSTGPSESYMATPPQLKAQRGSKSVLGLKGVLRVLYSKGLLRAEVLLSLGSGVELTNTDLGKAPALRTVIAPCLGLVIVEASPSIPRLIHPTLQGTSGQASYRPPEIGTRV